MTTLLAIAPPLVAFWGWACLALGVADRGPFAVLALVGFAGSIFAKRTPVSAAVVELAAGALLIVVASVGQPDERLAFIVTGALLVVIARAITEAGRRARG